MELRRKHTKSRHGCSECKRRKVKCDETRPNCSNCRRYGSQCSYQPSANKRRLSATPTPSEPTRNTHIKYDVSCGGLSALQLQQGHTPGPNTPPAGASWSRDAELSHHWCTVTADVMATNPDVRHMWRVVIPRIGYESCFVMHALLALSALHKAYLLPSRADVYLNISAHHQIIGSEGFRAVLANVTRDNWKPVFCFSGTLVVYIMCLPIRSPDGTLQSPVLSMLELISSMRGVQTSIKPFLPLFMASEFSPMVRDFGEVENIESQDILNPSLEDSLLPEDTFDALFYLRSFLETELPSEDQPTYLDAAEKLKAVTRIMGRAGLHAEPAIVFFWTASLDDVIISDSRAFRAPALAVIAYFAVFLAAFERTFWFLRQWAKSLLREIMQKAQTEPRLLQLLKWPEEKVWELAL